LKPLGWELLAGRTDPKSALAEREQVGKGGFDCEIWHSAVETVLNSALESGANLFNRTRAFSQKYEDL
jgi:hypothetical protein